MKKDDMTIDKTIITKKPRRLSAQWTMETPLPKEELDQLKKDSVDAFDKWAWDTGTDADKEKYKQLEKKLKHELTIADNQAAVDEIMDELSKELKKTIDDDILEKIKAAAGDET